MERLLNNNVEEYFYLHSDADAGIIEHSCAYLRFCFGLDSGEYYNHLTANRTVGLTDPFANKLGWHVGWLYARVGTEDWVPDHVKRAEFDRMIKDLILRAYEWIPDAKIREATEVISDWPCSECGLPKSPDEMRHLVGEMPGKTPRDKILGSIREAIRRVPAFNDASVIQMVLNTLLANQSVLDLPDPQAFCQSVEQHLSEAGVFTNEIIIDRVSGLLEAHEEFAAIPGRDTLLASLSSSLARTRFLDNDAYANKLWGLVSGDPEFKSSAKELERRETL
ncbi:MAG: hypothetical protein RDU20_02905 [Desulfomonilaceae bacterium]|nr:hypothetical protein [Desulfomonilaceae bacterium]